MGVDRYGDNGLGILAVMLGVVVVYDATSVNRLVAESGGMTAGCAGRNEALQVLYQRERRHSCETMR